jgi:hypothetical protein
VACTPCVCAHFWKWSFHALLELRGSCSGMPSEKQDACRLRRRITVHFGVEER